MADAPVRLSKYAPGEYTREEVTALADYVAVHTERGETVCIVRDSAGLLYARRPKGGLYLLSAAT